MGGERPLCLNFFCDNFVILDAGIVTVQSFFSATIRMKIC